jgi:protein subunit release factor B
MYIGRTPLAFLLTLVLIAVSHFVQSTQIESVSRHTIDLNRQIYNQLQLERSQDRTANEEQTRKIVAIEIARTTIKNPNINPKDNSQ